MIYLARNKSYLLCIFALFHGILYAHGSAMQENAANEAKVKELKQYFESKRNPIMQVQNLPRQNATNRNSGASLDSDAPSSPRSSNYSPTTSTEGHLYEEIGESRNSQHDSDNEYENVPRSRQSDSAVGAQRRSSLATKSSNSWDAASPIYAKLDFKKLQRHGNVSSLNSPGVIHNPHAVVYEELDPYQFNANRPSDSRTNSIRSMDYPFDFSNSKLAFNTGSPPSSPTSSTKRGLDEVPVKKSWNPLRHTRDSRKGSKKNDRPKTPPAKPPRTYAHTKDFTKSMFYPETYENGTGDVVEMTSQDAAYVRANMEPTPMSKKERFAKKLGWNMGGNTPREPKFNFLTGEDENEPKGFWRGPDRIRQRRLRKKADKNSGPPDYSDRMPCSGESVDQVDSPDSLSPGHENRQTYQRNKSRTSNASYENYKPSSGALSPFTQDEDQNQGVYENGTNRNSINYMRQNSVAPTAYYNPSTRTFSSSGSHDENLVYQSTAYENLRRDRPKSFDNGSPLDEYYTHPSGAFAPFAPDEDHFEFPKESGSQDEVSQKLKSSRRESSESGYSYFDPVVVARPGYEGKDSLNSEGKKKKSFRSFLRKLKPRVIKSSGFPGDRKYFYGEDSDDSYSIDESSTRETKEHMRRKNRKSRSSRASSAYPSRSVSHNEHAYSTLEDDTSAPKKSMKQRIKNLFHRKSQSYSPPPTPTTPKLAIDETPVNPLDIQKNTEEEFIRLKLQLQQQEDSTTA